MVPTMNDGSGRAPRLRTGINGGNLWLLPAWSAVPRGDDRAVYARLKELGIEAVQGGKPDLLRGLGMGCSGAGRIDRPEEADELARRERGAGMDCATVHVGRGHEDDDEADRLVGAILDASSRHAFPIYVETHRATITQDSWRTVQLTKRHPGLRFNGDFSHWYTGLEMVYGDWERRLSFLEPVFARVRYFHGRIGNSGQMQVALDDPTMAPAIAHVRELWTRSMLGFLRTARPGDHVDFMPELLPHTINYCRRERSGAGGWTEECDRFAEALRLNAIARDCFAEAQRRLATTG